MVDGQLKMRSLNENVPYRNLFHQSTNPIFRRAVLDKLYSCHNKNRYGDPVAATRAAYNLEQIRHGERFSVYKCRWCFYWHLGHTKDRSQYSYEFPQEIVDQLFEEI
jgi:hypothetical protein